MRKQNGITLVALVITIVVLVILAAVVITSVRGNDGLITKATNAATQHNEAVSSQETQINAYTDLLNQYIPTVQN